MSCFGCFSSQEKRHSAKTPTQPASNGEASQQKQQNAVENGTSTVETLPSTAAGSPHPQYIYPKAELDPQNARYLPIGSTSKAEVRDSGGQPGKSPGDKKPAFLAIPPLDSPINDPPKKKNHGKSQSAGKVLARPLFVEDLPALKSAQSLDEQPQAEGFQGFPTGKGDEPPPATVMDTADIWKPRLSDTGTHGGNERRLVTTGVDEGSLRTPQNLETRGGWDRARSADAACDEWAKSLRGGSQPNSVGSRRTTLKAAPRTKGASASDGTPPTKPSTITPTTRTPPQRTPRRASSGGSDSLSSDNVRDSDSGATHTGLPPTRSDSLSGAPAEPGQVGSELYELVSQLGVGETGVTKLMRDRRTGELVAAKWVPHMAGEMLSVKVEREILNHRKLLHPNVVRFREVFATDDHLVIVTDYAAAGNLADRVEDGGAVPEVRAKEFFRQVVEGTVYCHKLGIVHRNLRLEKLLLDGQAASPVVKISGFAYSKAPDLDSAPKSIIGGGPDFMAPELLTGSMNGMEGATYDGRAMDVWSIGVCLFTILCGTLPFKDSNEPGIMSQRLMRRIVQCDYSFPAHVPLSPECKDLVSRILTANPSNRIDSYDIPNHPWLKGTTLPKSAPVVISQQSETDISSVMERARRRKEARLERERAKQGQEDHFNEDLLPY